MIVGILDSGLDATLAAHVRASRSFVDGPGDPGHGGTVARIVRHHAPEATLLDAWVFGAGGRTTPEKVAAALDWLRAEGARLVNLSFGLHHDRAVLRAAVAASARAGVTLVASVPARGAPVYPGAYPGVIRVTGDTRCALGEISALGGMPADFGASPVDLEGGHGGASFAAAHVTGLLAGNLQDGEDPRALLRRRARFHGRERRLA